MSVIEKQAYGIIPHGLDVHDVHVLLAHLQNLLSRPVSLHFCRWRVDTQILARQSKTMLVVEHDLECAGLLV